MEQPIPLKVCSKCQLQQPVTGFHRRSSSRDGYRNECKKCVLRYDQERRERDGDRLRAQSAAYYAEHRDEITARWRERRRTDSEWAAQERQRSKDYYAADPEAAKARIRAWQLANPDKTAEYGRRWASRNPEKVRELSRLRMARLRAEDPEGMAATIRAWREANRDLVQAAKAAWIAANYEKHREHANASNRAYKKRNPDKRRDHYHRRRALKAEVSFGQIDLAETWELQQGACALCGQQMDRALRFPDPRSPSIDHTLPLSRGGTHTQDNVRWACLICNLQKGARVPDDTP